MNHASLCGSKLQPKRDHLANVRQMSTASVELVSAADKVFCVTIIAALSAQRLCSLELSGDSEIRQVKRCIEVQQGINVFRQRLFLLPGFYILGDDEVLANLDAFEGTVANGRKEMPVPAEAAINGGARAQQHIQVALLKLEYIETDLATRYRLVQAAWLGDVNALEYLLQKPVDPDSSSVIDVVGSCTPLIAASASGNLAAVYILCKAGANKDKDDDTDDDTALTVAAAHGHVDVVLALCGEGCDKDKANGWGTTPLMAASEAGHLEVARVLCEAGAGKDKADHDGQTALLRAAAEGKADVVHMLCEAGANKDKADQDGYTALSAASLSGEVEVVEVLCAAGADRGKTNRDGHTALTVAYEEGYHAVVGVLKKRVTVRDSKSVAAIMFKPWEASALEDICSNELWKNIQGRHFIEYHSDLASTGKTGGDYGIGVGLSCHATLLVNTIERLKQDEALRRLIVEKIYEEAMTEAKELLPHLKKLNLHQVLNKDDACKSLKTLSKQPLAEEIVTFPSEEDLEKAVHVLFTWLQAEQSPFRSLFVILSAGGLPYAAMTGERTLRAWVQGGGATEERATRAAKAIRTARMSGEEPASASSRMQEIASLFP